MIIKYISEYHNIIDYYNKYNIRFYIKMSNNIDYIINLFFIIDIEY